MDTGQRDQAARVSGQWFVLAAAVLWGTTGTAQAFAPPEATPAAIGSVRLLIGGAALLAVAWARGGIRREGRLPLKATLWAAGGMAVYQLCFFAAVARTGVAIGTVVAIGSAPVIAGVLVWLVRGERPGGRWLAATALAIAGCGLLILPGSNTGAEPIGVLLALAAGLSYAVYAVSSKDLLAGRSPDVVMAAVFSLGALFLLPVLLTSDLGWLAQPRGLAVALHLGLVATALAYLLFGRGLSAIAVATAVTLTLAEPLTAATLGIVILDERLTTLAILGVGLLFAGLALLSFTRRQG
jgi:DME family drug/metabolite transporter